MLRQIPTTIVLCLLFIAFASWPSVQTWAEQNQINHYLSHGLYFISGIFFGLQTAWWAHREAQTTHTEDAGVSS